MRTRQEVEDSHKVVVTSPVRRVSEPVVRQMVSLCPPPPPFIQKSRFTVLTYNILADLYTTSKQFPMSETFALQWQYRRQVILKELALYDADIVCLQEVQSTSFHEDLKPEMDRRGFDAVFKKKTQARSALLCMVVVAQRRWSTLCMHACMRALNLPCSTATAVAVVLSHEQAAHRTAPGTRCLGSLHGRLARETASRRCSVGQRSAIMVSCQCVHVRSLRNTCHTLSSALQ